MLPLLLLACGAPYVADVPAAEPAPTATPAAPTDAHELTITLDPADMTYDAAAGTATFSPGSRVKSASYTHYVLDLASLEAALGGRPDAPVAVVVRVIGGAPVTRVPDNPYESAPVGGFQITTWAGRVVKRAP